MKRRICGAGLEVLKHREYGIPSCSGEYCQDASHSCGEGAADDRASAVISANAAR